MSCARRREARVRDTPFRQLFVLPTSLQAETRTTSLKHVWNITAIKWIAVKCLFLDQFL